MRFFNASLLIMALCGISAQAFEPQVADLPPGLAMLPQEGLYAPNGPYCAFRTFRMDADHSLIVANTKNPFFPASPCNAEGQTFKLICSGYQCAQAGDAHGEYVEIINTGHFRYVTPQGSVIFYRVQYGNN